MNNKKITWTLAVVGIIVLIIYSKRDNVDESVDAPASIERGGKTEEVNIEGKVPGKYGELLGAISFTPEEEALRPEDTSEASWRATVFFHRQNVRDQNGTVSFYGKVIDQHGEPVVGADVFGYSDYYVESFDEQLEFGGGKRGRRNIEVKTDKDGLFVVESYQATDLNFTDIKKIGYHAKEKLPTGLIFGNSFSRRYSSDRSSPVIFPMWEKGDTEPLMKSRWRKSIIPDGRVYTLDIETGQVVEGGDLQVSISADYDAVPDTNRYPWKLKVSSPGGVVIESNDAFLYQAPDSDYSESLSWKIEEGKEWSRDLKRSLYVRLKSGVYAGVTIDAKAYHTNEARIVVNSFINPSGSRNLEYDPSKLIEGRK